MFEWFKRKAIEKSERNIRVCLSNVIEVANQADSNINRTGTANPSDMRSVQQAKDALIMQLCAPIPLEEVKSRLIDPTLCGNGVTEGARMAVNHAYECVLKEIGQNR